jgi:hypothetical protein
MAEMARKYTPDEVRLLLRAWADGDIRFERDRLTAKRLVRQLLDDTAPTSTTAPASAAATREQSAEPVERETPPQQPRTTTTEPVPDVIDLVGRLWRAAQEQVQQQMQRQRDGTPGRGLFAVPDECEGESPLDDIWKFVFRKLDEQSNRERGGER